MGEAKQKCCKMKRGSGRFGFFNRTQCTRDSTCTHRPGSVRRQARDMGLLRTVYSHAARCAATVRTVSLTRHEPRGSSLRHHRGLAFDDRPRRVQPAEFLQSPDSSPVDQAEFRS